MVSSKFITRFVTILSLMLASISSQAIIINETQTFSQSTDLASFLYGIGKVNGCTGTPIRRDVVLSAAHCFENRDADSLQDVFRASFKLPSKLNDGNFRGTYWGSVYNHPLFGGSFETTLNPVFDLALLFLDRPLPLDVPIFQMFALPNPTGAVVRHAGFGAKGFGTNGCGPYDSCGYNEFSSIDNRLAVADNVIAGLEFGDNIAVTSFDAPTSLGGNGSALETPIYGGGVGKECRINPEGNPLCTIIGYTSSEGTTARGDSGGPLLFNPIQNFDASSLPPGTSVKPLPNEYFVIGVTSFGRDANRDGKSSTYGDTSGYALLNPATDWIGEMLNGGIFNSSLSSSFSPKANQDYLLGGQMFYEPPIEENITDVSEPSILTLVLLSVMYCLRRRFLFRQ